MDNSAWLRRPNSGANCSRIIVSRISYPLRQFVWLLTINRLMQRLLLPVMLVDRLLAQCNRLPWQLSSLQGGLNTTEAVNGISIVSFDVLNFDITRWTISCNILSSWLSCALNKIWETDTMTQAKHAQIEILPTVLRVHMYKSWKKILNQHLHIKLIMILRKLFINRVWSCGKKKKPPLH